MIEPYRGRLPSALLEEWRAGGLGGVADGFLWLTDPGAFAPVMLEWGLGPWALVFARTGLGDLLFWDGEHVHCLYVHRGTVQRLPGDIPWLFEQSLCDEEYLDDVLDHSTYRGARERLGPPAADEMYTFVPALVLGGEEEAESMEKVRMWEQLLLLARLHAADDDPSSTDET